VARFGKYELVRKLATGGMAEVFLARFEWALGLEKTVVVKRILPHLAEDPSFCEMFFSEAKLAAQLSHPNIAQIIEFGEHEGTYFLSMEYVDGPSLRSLEYSAALREETIPFAHSARIAACCCEALAYAHELADARTGEPLQLVHRDVSPDNILIGRTGAVKLVDFGIAKAATQTHRTETGGVKGKLGYMSPEQLRAKPLDRRTDVYALGVVLYEMLSGGRPYDAPTEASLLTAILTEDMVPLHARSPDAPEALERIILRALQRRPEDRYPDCRAMHADLEEFLRATRQPATVFQLAQLAAQDSDTERAALGPRGALATPERPYPTARTPVPWRAEGTDAKRQAAAQLAESLAMTGTEDTYQRHSASTRTTEPAGLLSIVAPAQDDGAEGPSSCQSSSFVTLAPYRTKTSARRVKHVGIPTALVLSTAMVVAAVIYESKATTAAAPPQSAPAPALAATPPPAEIAAPQAAAPQAAEPRPPPSEASRAPQVPRPPDWPHTPEAFEGPTTSPSPTPLPPSRAPAKPAPVVELVLSSNPPSQLRILSGRKVVAEGRSPIAARVPPGAVTVEASAVGETPWFRRETLTLGPAPRQVSHTIAIEQGSVLIRTFPASRVTVDGVPRGDVPLKLTLFQGPHVVRLECDRRLPLCADRPVFTSSIAVEAGKSIEVMHKWE
jgi:serine/threonine-protein kinase